MSNEGVLAPVITRDGNWSILGNPGGWAPITMNGNTLKIGQTVPGRINVQLDINSPEPGSIRCAQLRIPAFIESGPFGTTDRLGWAD